MTPLKDNKAEEYAQHIREIVNQLKKTSKKALAENEAHLVPLEVAKEKYGGRIGETYYCFPNDAPSQEIIDAYERVKPYYGTGENAVSFEDHLSHRKMTVMFVDGDLVIRKDRELFIDRLTEECLRDRIQYAKDNYDIDWNKAKIFIFPYKTKYFYISDSFETTLAGGRSDLRNPDNWFTIPFTEDFDYSGIRRQCREFAKSRPLEDDDYTSATIKLDQSKLMGEEPVKQPEATKNKGCMLLLGLILIPSLLILLI
ncbi:MAG: hypothetical protein SPL96_00210 [Bacteroidales bacterium]|nr:hypothetical protein [Bacteroidales bacterium]